MNCAYLHLKVVLRERLLPPRSEEARQEVENRKGINKMRAGVTILYKAFHNAENGGKVVTPINVEILPVCERIDNRCGIPLRI